MDNQPAYLDPQHVKNVSLAIEVMSALVEGYDSAGNDPDTSLADYITNQMMVGKQTIPAPIWDLLSGFATMTLNLLGQLKHETGFSEQDFLDSLAEATAKMTAPDSDPDTRA